METEIIDLVDENDEVIGQATKEEAHENGLYHRISAMIITNDKGQIAMQKRAKNYFGGGLLDHSAAGHLSSGESYEDNAVREIKEELGIEINLKKIIYPIKLSYVNKSGKKISHIYSLFIGHYNGPFKLQESEVESVEFYDIEIVKKNQAEIHMMENQ